MFPNLGSRSGRGRMGRVLLNTLRAASTSIASFEDYTSFPAGYHSYEIVFDRIRSSVSGAQIGFQVHCAGAWQTSGYVSTATSAGVMMNVYGFGGIAPNADGVSGSCTVLSPLDPLRRKVFFGISEEVTSRGQGTPSAFGGWWDGGNDPLNGVRLTIQTSIASFAAGTCYVYGYFQE